MNMSRKEELTPEPTSMQRVSWKSRFAAWRAIMLTPMGSREMQPAPWKVRFFALFYLIAFSGVAAAGWREYQRGLTVSSYVGAGFILFAAFNISLLMVVLIRGRIPESWRKRKAR